MYQVAAAKSKGWTVYAYNGNKNEEYQGSYPVIAEINATNFPDANFRSYLMSQDYGKDGLITDEEIAAVTTINVSNKNIASLKGIEYFTALTELYCYRNQLTKLDVSKNTALTYLDCSYNKLTALDVSKNTALTELDCSSNQLTALDVSKNTALTALYCYDNQIKDAQMDALVNSLPTVSGGKFRVYAGSSDQNVCTKAQVATAKEKGWTAYNSSGEVYEGSSDVLKGDTNGDGKVDIVDVTSTISYILGQNPATFNKEAADVNGDKKVDIVDVTTIIDIILGK
jgi:Leucine-rich repeat (LRR) protein